MHPLVRRGMRQLAVTAAEPMLRGLQLPPIVSFNRGAIARFPRDARAAERERDGIEPKQDGGAHQRTTISTHAVKGAIPTRRAREGELNPRILAARNCPVKAVRPRAT